MVDELKLLKGSPIYVDKIAIYPITIGEITDDLGIDEYNLYLSLISISKEQYEITNEEITNFDIVCQICFTDNKLNDGRELKTVYLEALKQFLHKEVNFVVDDKYAYLIVNNIDEDDYYFISNSNYDQIIEIIKYQNCLINICEEDQNNPADEKTKQLLEKQKRARELLAKAKKQGDGEILTLADLVSILISNGNGITPFNVWDMNFYMFNNQFNRMKMLDEYNINVRSLLAGAKAEDINLKHWMSKVD